MATSRADEAVVYLHRALEEGAPGDDRGALLAALGVAAFDAGLPEACGWLLAAAEEGGVRTVDVVGRLAAFGVVVAGFMWLIRRWHQNNLKRYPEEVAHLLAIARSDKHH